MHRRLIGLAAAALVAVAACSAGATPTPSLAAADIVAQSLDAVSHAKTVHARADVTGSIPFDLGSLMGGLDGSTPAPGASGGSMDLAGTYLETTADIAAGNGTLTISVPAILGLKMDAIKIGDTSYSRINLMGDQWQKSTSSPGPDATPAPSQDVASMVADVKKALSAPGVTTEKLADEKCGDAQCYHVKITAPASALSGDAGGLLSGLAGGLAGGLGGGLGSGIVGSLTSPQPGASPLVGGDVTIEWWARTSDLRPAKVVLGATAQGQAITVTVTMDAWDETVTISPPPADKVTEQPSFETPSLAP